MRCRLVSGKRGVPRLPGTRSVIQCSASVSQCAVAQLPCRLALHRAGTAAACGSAWQPSLVAHVAHARYGHPLRFYIRPHFVKRPPVATLKLRLVPAAATRPTGLQNRPYAKWPSLESGRVSRRRFPVAARPTRRRLGTLIAGVAPWHQSVRFAQCFMSVACGQSPRISPVRPHGAPNSHLRALRP